MYQTKWNYISMCKELEGNKTVSQSKRVYSITLSFTFCVNAEFVSWRLGDLH